MSFKYNILWLDDEPIKALETIRQANPSVSFEQVNYVDICEMILDFEPEKYHAVILDANGVKSDSPDKDANKSGFLSLVHLVKEKCIPLYIYSGQLLRASDGDTADVILEELKRIGLQEEKTIFYKSGGPYKMIDQIISDLDSKYHYYIGHEYLLDFFSKGWIENKYKSSELDPVMECYKNHNIDYARGNQMRKMTEQILKRVNKEFHITNFKEGDPNYCAEIAKTIKRKKLDESEAISGLLLHMVDLSNAGSHHSLPEEVRKLYFESDYATFFTVTDWFNRLMSRVEQARTIPTDKEDVVDAQKLQEPKDTPSTTKQAQIQKPKTHERTRTGVVVSTYKEGGRTFCDLKVEIPTKWENYSELYITGVSPNTNPYNKAVWFPYCEEVQEDKKTNDEIPRS